VSAGPDPQVDRNLIEQTRKQVNRLFEEVGRLTELDIKPAEFYAEFLGRVLTGLMAPAGAVWAITAQGNLQLQHQINLRQIGLDGGDKGRQAHDELLRQAMRTARPMMFPPHSGTGNPEGGAAAAGNLSDYLLLVAPVVVDDQVIAMVEVWQFAERHPDAAGGYLKFLTDMARLASLYARNYQRRQMTGQQQLWVQLESFARKIHASLNPTEVAYLVANEGRRLIDCDRVSVALFHGRGSARIEAISGVDVVERRSNLVRLMRKLCNRVAHWREKLVYTGVKDDSLPPDVLAALDAYLAESNSKLLTVVPLRDEREKDNEKRSRSALLMECFEPAAAPEQLVARLDVIGQHATSALYNSVEYRRIPFRFLWKPMATLQEGLGGKARMIVFSVVVGLALFLAAMYFLPWPLKMEAQGHLQPIVLQNVCAPQVGTIESFDVDPGQVFGERHDVGLAFDQELKDKLQAYKSEIVDLGNQESNLGKGTGGVSRIADELKRSELQTKAALKAEERRGLIERTNSVPGKPGFFRLRAPDFRPGVDVPRDKRLWTVLSTDYRENFTGMGVKPTDKLILLGNNDGPWEVELMIPQKHYGQVKYALLQKHADPPESAELDVDLLVKSDPTHSYWGKLRLDAIGGHANPQKDESTDNEPVVAARVRIDGSDIPEADRIPRELLLNGTEVKAKIQCGNRKMGYSLFYGVWEFAYEKIAFRF
jgi:hypothetical protein